MQKVIITYLASLILFQGMFAYLDIIFEIGEVLEDYELHKVKYGDDLSTFISKHFGDLKESHKKEHQEEHKHHNHPIQTGIENVEVYVLQTLDFSINTTLEIISTTNNFGNKDLFSTFEKQKIFQPPQLT